MRLTHLGYGTGKYSKKGVLESRIVAKTLKRLKEQYPAAVILKTHGGAYTRSGVPDIYMAYKRLTFWLEIKREGGDTTATQLRMLERLDAVGCYVGVFTDAETVLRVVGEIISESESE